MPGARGRVPPHPCGRVPLKSRDCFRRGRARRPPHPYPWRR
jgi:hypothetical protein